MALAVTPGSRQVASQALGEGKLPANTPFSALNVTGTGSTDMAGAWTSTTSPVTAQSGTFTSANCTIRYKKFGRTVFVNVIVNIVTVGTASGYVLITLPFSNMAGSNSTMSGRDGQSGKSLIGFVSPSSASLAIFLYDSTSAILANAALSMQGTYEAAA